LPWKRLYDGVEDSPVLEPLKTVTEPALPAMPTSSPGAPTARSKKSSLLKSPAVRAVPKKSPTSGLACWSTWPAPVSPLAEP
jgi:hypothetical protein